MMSSADPYDARADGTVADYARSVASKWTRAVLTDEVPQAARDIVTCPVCMEPSIDAVVHCMNGHSLCASCSRRCSAVRRRTYDGRWGDAEYDTDDTQLEDEVGVCPMCRCLPLSDMHLDGVRVPNLAVRSMAREYARRECTTCDERGSSWDVCPQPCEAVCRALDEEFDILRAQVLAARVERIAKERLRVMAARAPDLTESLERLGVAMTQRNGARQWCRRSLNEVFYTAGETEKKFGDKLRLKAEAVLAVNLDRIMKAYLYNKRL